MSCLSIVNRHDSEEFDDAEGPVAAEHVVVLAWEIMVVVEVLGACTHYDNSDWASYLFAAKP